jgi:hypothetical protein
MLYLDYCMESIIFDVMEVNLPFNTILGRMALSQFMVVAHYGYLVLKMSLPNGVIKVRGDCSTDISVLEKLQALATAQEAAADHFRQDQAPLS